MINQIKCERCKNDIVNREMAGACSICEEFLCEECAEDWGMMAECKKCADKMSQETQKKQ